MSDFTGENLLRLMAAEGLSVQQVSERTGLDLRTVAAILRGTKRPHARTIHRLAEGLDVTVDELFLQPAQLLYRQFDRQTNPAVEEALQSRQDLFADWTQADFDELHSRVGTGGGLTVEGALAAAQEMNHKRELHEKLDLLLESSQADVVGGIVELLYGQVVVEKRPK